LTALFIDSTYDITLGILGDDMGWIKFQRYVGQKASSVIQKEAHQLLQDASLRLQDLTHIVTIAGPGFYTGLRLSEGFADVMTFFGAKHLSLLSYDLPALSGIESGIWMTKAYRGEYFFTHWAAGKSENVLVAAKDLETYLESVDKSKIYIHSESAIDELCKKHLTEFKTTHDLLKSHSQVIFKEIFRTEAKVESFYFRPPEDEFKVSV
jgi:tRNA threonylcarbamoyladenosine biosynthesis protein TsaB